MEQMDISNSRSKTAKHPKALYILFFTEMWERFAYYLMVGILLLYLIDDKTGGKGFSEHMGADIVGSFIALVYLTPFIGGLLADRHFGYIKSIFLRWLQCYCPCAWLLLCLYFLEISLLGLQLPIAVNYAIWLALLAQIPAMSTNPLDYFCPGCKLP